MKLEKDMIESLAMTGDIVEANTALRAFIESAQSLSNSFEDFGDTMSFNSGYE